MKNNQTLLEELKTTGAQIFETMRSIVKDNRIKDYKSLSDSLDITVRMFFAHIIQKKYQDVQGNTRYYYSDEEDAFLIKVRNNLIDEIEKSKIIMNDLIYSNKIREHRDMLIAYDKMLKIKQRVDDAYANSKKNKSEI